jgi:hypothetical protein
MTLEMTKNDLAFLTENIVSPPDQLLLLRASLELALLRLGHEQDNITQALDGFYKRTLH